MRTRPTLLVLPILFAACTDDEAKPPANGGAADLDFAGTSGSNVDTSPIAPTDVGVVFAEGNTRVIGVFGNEPEVDGFRRKAWQLALSFSGEIAKGATYPAALKYEESPVGGWLSWSASGSITIESVDPATLTFSVPMTPSIGGSGNAATGDFTLGGTITVDSL